ncbi:hypothetical protein GCM10022198_06900 [Klugiella xanthotipulae]|uniref:3-methyladenine DNA glycosylase AlkC n=1 Tax=Klugiella xanthotipulae TaxID=244735 RepID=A0A543HT74_9MICO|nr:DNA alkylation repair protein [Klugiella xanthotipulae]TQM61545.1 3-methyladenine DNA glycosylase AlkC [Klugiella xanthotipulae]
MPTADELLGAEVVDALAEVLQRACSSVSFDRVRESAGQLDGLALRERSDLVTAALLLDLPGGIEPLGATIHAALSDDNFTGWMVWPVTEAVASAAITEGSEGAIDVALALLGELTGRLTSEFALRPLLNAYLERTLSAAHEWAWHPSEHVRRLASEGTRPYLPWGTRVHALLQRPEATLPILDALYRDPSESVRRSVANHLNDLSRLHGDLVVQVATRWLAEPTEHTAPLVRRALRTLVKRGHPGALALLGFAPAPRVAVTGPILDVPCVEIGGKLGFEVALRNEGAESSRLAIDYIVHHRKANGSLTPKVFKFTTTTLAPGEATRLTKQHSFAPISTRAYHLGEHAIEVQVNGVVHGRAAFTLADSAEGPSAIVAGDT